MSTVTATRRTTDRLVDRDPCIECGHPHFLPVRYRRKVSSRMKLFQGYYEPCPADGCACSFGDGE